MCRAQRDRQRPAAALLPERRLLRRASAAAVQGPRAVPAAAGHRPPGRVASRDRDSDRHLPGLPSRTVTPDSALVTGYYFLTRQANEISTQAAAVWHRPANQPPLDTLINDTWTAAHFRTSLLRQPAAARGLNSLNSHFAHNRFFPNDANNVFANEVTSSTTNFHSSLIFSVRLPFRPERARRLLPQLGPRCDRLAAGVRPARRQHDRQHRLWLRRLGSDPVLLAPDGQLRRSAGPVRRRHCRRPAAR